MLLSAEMLLYELEKRFDLGKVVRMRNERQLKRPTIYRPGMALEPDYAYIVENPETEDCAELADAGVFLIVCRGQLATSSSHGNTAVCFAREYAVADVLDGVWGAFEKYDSWDASLRELMLERSDLADMLSISTSVFENSLVLCAADTMPLIHAVHTAEGNSKTYPKVDVSPQVIMGLHSYTRGELADHLYDREPYETTAMPGYKGMVLRLYAGSAPAGFLVVTEKNPLRAFDGDLITHLGRYIEHMIASFPHHTNMTLNRVMRELLDGSDPNPDTIKPLLNIVGFREGERYRCLVVKAIDDQPEELYDLMARQIAGDVLGSIAFEYSDKLFVLVNETFSSRVSIDYATSLKKILEHYECLGGLSDDFDDIGQVRAFYTQANEMLDMASEIGLEGPILPFGDYGADYIAYSCRRALSAETIFSPGFKRLIEHDRENTTKHLETLEVYLDENLNASRAAKRVFVQRNSFLYRLERMQAMLDEDLNDPEVRFRLNAYLRMYKQM